MAFMNRFSLVVLLCTILFGFAIACDNGDDDDDTGDDDSNTGDDDTGDDDTGDDDTGDDDTGDDDDDTGSEPSTKDCEPYGYETTPQIVRGPYLQHVTQNSVRILWQTDQRSNSVIRFGLEEDLGYYQCDLEPTTFHEMELALLSPETAYHYQVRSDGAQSQASTFATAPNLDAPFTFAVYGDNRTQPLEHQAIVDGISQQLPDLVISVGDVVTDGWDLDQFDTEFFDQTGDMMSRVPLYISIGNHEKESFFYYMYFSFPSHEKWYSFDYGSARFLMLNTNLSYIAGSQQYDWFVSELQRAQTEQVPWLFVASHHPAYSAGWAGFEGRLDIREHLLPLMENYGVDIYFNGHTHDYERGELNGVMHVLTGGGGGPLSTWAREVEHITMYKSCHHYMMVDINGNTANVTAIDQAGAEIDSFSLEH